MTPMQRFLKTKVVGKMTLISGNKLNIILKITPVKKKRWWKITITKDDFLLFITKRMAVEGNQ